MKLLYSSESLSLKALVEYLNIFCTKDQSLMDLDNLPEPDILAQEIVDNIESALGSLKEIVNQLD